MPQAIATSAPPPPAVQQQPRDIGDAVRRTVEDAVAGALAPARAALEAEVQKLSAEREQLQIALDNATSQPARRELERQVARVENRLHEAQMGLDKLNARLSTRDGPGFAVVGTPQAPPPPMPDPSFNPAPMVIAVMGILFIGFPIAVTIARLLWKRGTNAPPAALGVEAFRRFDRLEQSVDAIAIEVERISENQRYLTRLLGEAKQPKIGA